MVEVRKLFAIKVVKLLGVEVMKLFVVEATTGKIMEFLIGCIGARLVVYIMAIIAHNDKQLALCSSF